jgi:hypothetical protein
MLYARSAVAQNLKRLPAMATSLPFLIVGVWPQITGGFGCQSARYGREAESEQVARTSGWTVRPM